MRLATVDNRRIFAGHFHKLRINGYLFGKVIIFFVWGGGFGAIVTLDRTVNTCRLSIPQQNLGKVRLRSSDSEPPLLGNASIFPKLVSATLPSARAIGGMHFVICMVWQRSNP